MNCEAHDGAHSLPRASAGHWATRAVRSVLCACPYTLLIAASSEAPRRRK